MQHILSEKIDLSEIETDASLIGSRPGQLLQSKASIIYLPGFGCDFDAHKEFANMLTSYDYYAINFPAHGNSGYKNVNELTLTHFTNIVLQFISDRDLKDVIIIGHGSSAAVASNVSQILSNIVRAVILVSPLETLFQEDAGKVEDVMIPRLIENLEQLNNLKVFNYHLKSLNSDFWKNYNNKKLTYFNKNYLPLSIILNYLLSPELKQSIELNYKNIQVPCLLVFGDSDGMIRLPEVLSKAQTMVDNAKVCVIPISGHEPFFDNPKNYFSNVVSFIDEVMFNFENKKGDM